MVTDGALSFLISLFTNTFFSILAGLVSGILVSIVGVCITTIAGSLLMTVGTVSSGFVTSPYLLYLTYGVTAGTYLQQYRIYVIHRTGIPQRTSDQKSDLSQRFLLIQTHQQAVIRNCSNFRTSMVRNSGVQIFWVNTINNRERECVCERERERETERPAPSPF